MDGWPNSRNQSASSNFPGGGNATKNKPPRFATQLINLLPSPFFISVKLPCPIDIKYNS